MDLGQSNVYPLTGGVGNSSQRSPSLSALWLLLPMFFLSCFSMAIFSHLYSVEDRLSTTPDDELVPILQDGFVVESRGYVWIKLHRWTVQPWLSLSTSGYPSAENSCMQIRSAYANITGVNGTR